MDIMLFINKKLLPLTKKLVFDSEENDENKINNFDLFHQSHGFFKKSSHNYRDDNNRLSIRKKSKSKR